MDDERPSRAMSAQELSVSKQNVWCEFKKTCYELDRKHGDRWFSYLQLGKGSFLVKRMTCAQVMEKYTMVFVINDKLYFMNEMSLEHLFLMANERFDSLLNSPVKEKMVAFQGWSDHRTITNMDCYAAIAFTLEQPHDKHEFIKIDGFCSCEAV